MDSTPERDEADRLIPPRKAVTLFGVSSQSLRNWHAAGRSPPSAPLAVTAVTASLMSALSSLSFPGWWRDDQHLPRTRKGGPLRSNAGTASKARQTRSYEERQADAPEPSTRPPDAIPRDTHPQAEPQARLLPVPVQGDATAYPDPDILPAARYLLRQGWTGGDAFHAGLDLDLAAMMITIETAPSRLPPPTCLPLTLTGVTR